MDHLVTLTRSELEKPFRYTEPDRDPLTGPTRLALEIEDRGDVFMFTEYDPAEPDAVAVTSMPKANH